MSEYKTSERNGMHLITLPDIVNGETDNLETAVKTWLISTADIHVLEMKATKQFNKAAYRAFVSYNQTLKANKKKLFCMGLSPELLTQFKADGVAAVFVQVATLDEAKRRGAPTRVVDVELINPFIKATVTVLETQANLKLVAGRPYVRKPDEVLPMEIAGVIGLSCSEFTGSIALCFRAGVFLNIYESLTGEKHETMVQETEDAAGELLNMIFGQAKTVLNDQKGYTLDKALPTILVGEKLKIRHQSRSPALVLPFEGACGAFHVEISIELA